MSSKRHLRRRSCEGKIAFQTEAAAWARVRRDQLRGLHPYRCAFAGHWHLGHSPRVTKEQVLARRQGLAWRAA